MIWQEKKELFEKGWETEFGDEHRSVLEEIVRETAGDILKMTTAAGSGHPGGSLSSRRVLALLYAMAKVSPEDFDLKRYRNRNPGRDRIIIDIGHVAPAVYATLAQFGFFSREDPIIGLRRPGSIFSGHIESNVPGVEWNTGCLGPGFPAAVGKAYYARKSGLDFVTYVLLGDGGQQKEQVAGGRSLAITLDKRGELGKLVAFVDYNNMQLSGSVKENTEESIEEVMRQWEGSGWEVRRELNNFMELHHTVKDVIRNYFKPTVILVSTKMGEGVSFMEEPEDEEGKPDESLAWKYHGKVLSKEDCKRGLKELGVKDDLESCILKRRGGLRRESYEVKLFGQRPKIELGKERIVYPPEEEKGRKKEKVKVACREAFGKEIERLSEIEGNKRKMVNVDPDMWPSTKMPKEIGVRVGVREIAAAGFAGGLSQEEMVVFMSTFGVFVPGEVYNTLRMVGMNQGTKVCVVGTHCGLDVGEDGWTHQCIDYLGLARNLLGFKVLCPADGNQAREMARYVVNSPGNYFVFMGRSKREVISDIEGKAFFGNNFELGKAYWLREGKEGTIITYGNMVGKALKVRERLKGKGLDYGVLCFSTLFPSWLLDKEAIKKAVGGENIVVYEDHLVETGLGNMIADELMKGDYPAVKREGFSLKKFGIEKVGKSGKPEELYGEEGLDVGGMVERIVYGG